MFLPLIIVLCSLYSLLIQIIQNNPETDIYNIISQTNNSTLNILDWNSWLKAESLIEQNLLYTLSENFCTLEYKLQLTYNIQSFYPSIKEIYQNYQQQKCNSTNGKHVLLPASHINKDSLEWQRPCSNPNNSNAAQNSN